MDFELNLNSDLVERVDSGEPTCVAPETTLRETLQLMKQRRRGHVLVCRDQVLVGIFTERDALRVMAEDADFDAPVETVMAADPATVSSSDTVGAAIKKMSQGGYRHMPIVDASNRPVGVVRVSSVLHYLVEHFPNVIYTLPPAPHHMTQEREGA